MLLSGSLTQCCYGLLAGPHHLEPPDQADQADQYHQHCHHQKNEDPRGIVHLPQAMEELHSECEEAQARQSADHKNGCFHQDRESNA